MAFVLIAACLSIVRASANDLPPNLGVDVFVAGEEDYKAFRIPGITSTNTGRLLAFAEGRKYGCGDFDGQHNVVMKTSDDNGATWSKLQVLLDPHALFGENQCPLDAANSSVGSCEFWDPTPVFETHTGQIFLMTARSWKHAGLTNEQSRMQGYMDMWIISSKDNGLTWSQPKNITTALWSDKYHLGTPSNGHGIQTQTGRLIMPNYLRPTGSDSSTFSSIFYSDDYGVTWEFANNSMVGEGTSESDVVELQHTPSRLMFNHRLGGGMHVRYKSYSDDNGMTWHGFAPVPALPDPGCKGGIAAWPAQKALFFVNAATTNARVNITLRMSSDDGETWPTSKFISGPGGYSDVIVTSPTTGADSVCVIFEFSTCTIKVACVDPTEFVTTNKQN